MLDGEFGVLDGELGLVYDKLGVLDSDDFGVINGKG